MLNKIIWLASYPKSGNTFLRLLLTNYLFNEENLNQFELIRKIPKFEKKELFENILKKKINSENFDYIKNSLFVQEELCKKFSPYELIFKTHHFYGSLDGNKFTSSQYTNFFIYIVRDPREVLVSYAHHSGITIKDCFEVFIDKSLGHKKIFETIIRWDYHYKSWRSFKNVPSIIIKYEDLIDNTEKVLSKVLKELAKILNFSINSQKIKKAIKDNEFSALKKLEKKSKFHESINDNFFRSGKKDTWKDFLTKDQIKIIEKEFNSEMKELNYL
tara:strand:- start:1053 stop:1871 length:819 start_codon:yes stop_codon:yes gene_type:complete